MTALGDLYFAETGLSPNELSQSKLFCKEFEKGVGVETAREITHDAAAEGIAPAVWQVGRSRRFWLG